MAAAKKSIVYTETTFSSDDAAKLDFCDAQFEDCTFLRANLQGRDLRRAKLLDCTFEACNLVVAQVIDCTFARVAFRECRLAGINWSAARKLEVVSFSGCQLNDASFLGLRLDGCEFTGCIARGTSFRDANLAKVVFRGSDLTGAEFVNCDLRGADFRGASNYTISPTENRLEKARFALPEAVGLLHGFGIILGP